MRRARNVVTLPIEDILESSGEESTGPGTQIGSSREGRPITGYRLGQGPLRLSLIGGCHADEPVGPAMLERLVGFLSNQTDRSPLVTELSWWIVPHVNPDGERRNAPWSRRPERIRDHRDRQDRAYDPVLYVRHVVREQPGDDIEFGFPRSPGDAVRPENRAVTGFLTPAAPFDLHASFHGMGFAPGPWFLLEPSWIERTATLRRGLRKRVSAMGYPLFDVDRKGEKGFHRIDEGFSTRPDSTAMSAHFRARGDQATAARFRPSSMEMVRRLGGDPLTLVSEMPLFLVPAPPGAARPWFRPGTEGKRELQTRLQRLAAGRSHAEARREIDRLGIRPMPIRDQMRLQLAYLDEALRCVETRSPE